MPFQLDNNFKEGNSPEYFFSRTNPLANSTNAVILKIENPYCDRLELVTSAVVAGGGAALTLTNASPTSGYTLRFMSVTVSDGEGNFVTNVGTGTVAAVVVNTSTLDANSDWNVIVKLEEQNNPAIDCGCATDYLFYVQNPASNPTVAIDTTTIGAQVLAITEADGVTVVADGGAYAIGAFAAGGTTEPFTIGLKNTGKHVLKITSATPAGDVLSITLGTYDKVVYPGQVILISGTVDASGIAGPYTGTVTVVSDDPTNASYVIDIDYTLA
jgi:hypothetical protein